MKIEGRRSDGSLLLSLGGGVGVILRAPFASRPTDMKILASMGEWSPVENTLDVRRVAARDLDKSRAVPIEQFRLESPKSSKKNLSSATIAKAVNAARAHHISLAVEAAPDPMKFCVTTIAPALSDAGVEVDAEVFCAWLVGERTQPAVPAAPADQVAPFQPAS